MIIRRLTVLALLATLLGSGGYVITYLVRWEWQRAVFSALVFLAAEVALAALWITNRLGAASSRPAPWAAPAAPAHPATDGLLAGSVPTAGWTGAAVSSEQRRLRAVLAAGRPALSNPFSWLDPASGRTNVFIPLLLGAGLLLSALAWVVERVAAAVAKPRAVSSMAAELASLRLPARLVPPRVDPGWAYRPGAWSWTATAAVTVASGQPAPTGGAPAGGAGS
ncbi:hypothetical protein I6A84_10560 [Frankia sp. CNm7]|uniref:Uncharacterized protein n=1 Tax=Frankia nepalensis TaxID=1836974 RepID=A0A937RI99_9ACTN|nr:hypothetical protein [Frankia nepalensis]MBL7498042.1 hypothetical protein [Frankia nepalensis]MBL7513569.1 hypothetical protein [Frankia nepalensis]MBL7518540.1 hypothetical protein [Frankia nepalensis]MBL7629344.1 hypothetical protein [Frankia nepalensis]